MAFDSRVYRILIASPSDVEVEREIAVKVIQEWNDLNSHTRKLVLLPLRWETHTAPEYGVRPQEVINRAIVDDCDLLLGLFWARIGSPTGAALSGTLEEIDRVGKAGKPIMLYFSRIGVNPEEVETEQLDRLKAFKKQTYTNGLFEHYTSHIDFRDKFSRQLELRVRDLQKADSPGKPPLSLSVVDFNAKFAGDSVQRTVKRPHLSDVDEALGKESDELEASLLKRIDARIREVCTIPCTLAIRNSGSSGIRNVYVELYITSASNTVEVHPPTRVVRYPYTWPYPSPALGLHVAPALDTSAFVEAFDRVTESENDGLFKDEDGWRVNFTWDAIQPQRIRPIETTLFISALESTKIAFGAVVYADNFPQPVELHASLEIAAEPTPMKLEELVGNVQEFKNPTITQWGVTLRDPTQF